MKNRGALTFVFLIALYTTFPVNIRAQEGTLPGFAAIMEALKCGHRLSVVIDYGKCDLFLDGKKQKRMAEITGGMVVDAWEYFSAGSVRNRMAFLVFSTAKLIKNPIGKGMVYNYVKVKVTEDDSVTVTAQYLRPGSYKVLMNELFRGVIDDGKNNGGLHFFK